MPTIPTVRLADSEVVLIDQYVSKYPYSTDGRLPMPTTKVDILDPYVALTYAAALTKKIRLGTGDLAGFSPGSKSGAREAWYGRLRGHHHLSEQSKLVVVQLALPAEGRWAMAARLKAQEVAHLLVGMAEAGRGVRAFEAKHRTGALLNGSMALLQEIIRVACRALGGRRAKF